jgi:hypothetical protein
MNPPIKLKSDVTANNSAKTITVPRYGLWAIKSIFVKLATTATVGNRQLRLSILTADNTVIFFTEALAVQAASLTYRYHFVPGVPNEDHNAKLWLQNGLPADLKLPAGYKIKIEDTAAVAAAADDMDVHILYENQFQY